MLTIKKAGHPASTMIEKIVELSQSGRREGILALENQQIEDPFFAKALRLAVGGTLPEEIRETLVSEIVSMKQRHTRSQKLFKLMAASAPAMEMLGTLIGLVQSPKGLHGAMSRGRGVGNTRTKQSWSRRPDSCNA